MDRDQLDQAVGGRYWDPLHARFRAALREAEEEGRVRPCLPGSTRQSMAANGNQLA
jgi:hypothetical protein